MQVHLKVHKKDGFFLIQALKGLIVNLDIDLLNKPL